MKNWNLIILLIFSEYIIIDLKIMQKILMNLHILKNHFQKHIDSQE